tara:strand:+ start:3445 stop:3687 length:243 start_codon:yes stop_codon:yes gene_type:complete
MRTIEEKIEAKADMAKRRITRSLPFCGEPQSFKELNARVGLIGFHGIGIALCRMARAGKVKIHPASSADKLPVRYSWVKS